MTLPTLIPSIMPKLLQLTRNSKRAISISADMISLTVALVSAYLLTYSFDTSFGLYDTDWRWGALGLLLLTGSFLLFWYLRLYRAVVRYVSVRALMTVGLSLALSTLWLGFLIWFLGLELPVVAIINYGLIALLLVGGSRLAMRELYQRMMTRRKERVIIYGAGSAGRQLAQALIRGEQFHPVAFIDDDATLERSTIMGIAVVAPPQLSKLIGEFQVKRILLALPSAPRSVRKGILESLSLLKVKVQTIPGMADMVTGDVGIDELQDVRIEDLLGRDPVDPNTELMQRHITGKVVMVTGAGGSIGSELCRQIVLQKPRAIVLFELSEYALYSIDTELRETITEQSLDVEVFPVIGAVQRQPRIQAVMQRFGVQTVYHAAAYKHVPLVEFNIVEGVHNNVFGTWHTAEAAAAAGVERFVLISTDKAVRPTNVMGTTKRLAELALQGLATRKGVRTHFSIVRFGNVLGSSGSVVPLFRQQIAQGGPITVTHPDITRYFMTIPEAAQLVIQAGNMGSTGSVFVLDMGQPIKIVDLAKKMIKLSGLELRCNDNPLGDIEIAFTGLRPGEKLYEELLIGSNVHESMHPRIMQADEVCLEWPQMHELLLQLKEASLAFDIERMRALMLEAPTAYTPNDEHIRDLMWKK